MHRKRFTSPFKYRLQEGVKTREGAGVAANYGKGSRGLSCFAKPQFEPSISPYFFLMALLLLEKKITVPVQIDRNVAAVKKKDKTLTHCGRVTQICVFNTVKLGTSASSP